MRWENVWETRGLVSRFSGDVTLDDMVSSGRNAYEDLHFIDIEYWFSDFSRVTGVALSAADLRDLVEEDRFGFEHKPDLKLALIGGSAVVRSLMNIYNVYLETAGAPWAMKLFDDEASARRWLEQPAKKAMLAASACPRATAAGPVCRVRQAVTGGL